MIKKSITTLLAAAALLSSSLCFAGNNQLNAQLNAQLKNYHDMGKANATGASIEKKGQLNTRYEYTGVQIAQNAVKLGFKVYLNPAFKYYNGEQLEIREIPNNSLEKTLHLDVSSVSHDVTIYMAGTDNYIRNKFKQLCGLILPKSGGKLYQNVISTTAKQKEKEFKIDGRTIKVILINNKYDIFISPYAPGTVKVEKNEIFTGSTIIPKLRTLGFVDLDLAGSLRLNKYGKTGDITFNMADFNTGNGQYDITMLIEQSNPELDKKYKQIFNWILPKSGNIFYNMLDKPSLPKTKVIYLDGRRIEVQSCSYGVMLLFGPIHPYI